MHTMMRRRGKGYDSKAMGKAPRLRADRKANEGCCASFFAKFSALWGAGDGINRREDAESGAWEMVHESGAKSCIEPANGGASERSTVRGYDDENDERLDDPEGLDDHDVDDSDSVDTEPCRHCGRQISEYAEVCPYCGNYVSREDAPRRKSPWVVICVAVLLIVILVCWVLTKPQP